MTHDKFSLSFTLAAVSAGQDYTYVHVVFSGIRDALSHKDVSVWIELSVFIKWGDDSHCR